MTNKESMRAKLTHGTIKDVGKSYIADPLVLIGVKFQRKYEDIKLDTTET